MFTLIAITISILTSIVILIRASPEPTLDDFANDPTWSAQEWEVDPPAEVTNDTDLPDIIIGRTRVVGTHVIPAPAYNEEEKVWYDFFWADSSHGEWVTLGVMDEIENYQRDNASESYWRKELEEQVQRLQNTIAAQEGEIERLEEIYHRVRARGRDSELYGAPYGL
jgi:hypothetical protein